MLGPSLEREEGEDRHYLPAIPVPQAFASEKAFGVLSETLYELLQLVSKSPPYTSTGRECLTFPRQRRVLSSE